MPCFCSDSHAGLSACSATTRRIACMKASALAGRELEAGRDARPDRRLVGVDHRIGEPAGACDDRHAAIAQAVELGQPARLEARRDEDRVAAALHGVRQALVIADDHADPAAMAGRAGKQRALQRMVAGAEHRKLGAGRDQPIADGGQYVDALLPGQAADHAKQRAVVMLEAEALLDRAAVDGAALHRLRREIGGEHRVRLRDPRCRCRCR